MLTRWWRSRRVASDPLFHVVVVELFAPQRAGEGLTLHSALILSHGRRAELGAVEGVGFGRPKRQHLFGVGERVLIQAVG